MAGPIRILSAIGIAALCGAVVTAAAQQRRGGRPDLSSLRNRVQQYWARRQAKDLVGAYPFYCQSYRSRVSLNDFTKLTRLNRFDISDVRVVDITQDHLRYGVRIAYRFVAPMLTTERLDGEATEEWMRESNGQWCKADEPLALPFNRDGDGRLRESNPRANTPANIQTPDERARSRRPR